MKPSMMLVAVHLGIALGLGSVSSAQEAAIRITVYEEIRAGRATYHYAVTNNGDRPIKIVWIGVDAMTGDFVLTAAPVGWAGGQDVARTSILAPAGWTSTVLSAEESTNVAIEWRAGSRVAIAPGQTLRGFRVTLLRPTASYKSTGWQTTDQLAGVTTGKLEQMRSVR